MTHPTTQSKPKTVNNKHSQSASGLDLPGWKRSKTRCVPGLGAQCGGVPGEFLRRLWWQKASWSYSAYTSSTVVNLRLLCVSFYGSWSKKNTMKKSKYNFTDGTRIKFPQTCPRRVPTWPGQSTTSYVLEREEHLWTIKNWGSFVFAPCYSSCSELPWLDSWTTPPGVDNPPPPTGNGVSQTWTLSAFASNASHAAPDLTGLSDSQGGSSSLIVPMVRTCWWTASVLRQVRKDVLGIRHVHPSVIRVKRLPNSQYHTFFWALWMS